MGLGSVLALNHLMQFRAEVSDRESLRIIHLSGRLEREQSPELIGLCDLAPKAVQLELGDLVSADAVGLQTLGMLRRRGAELAGASPYIAMQLEFEQSKHTRELRTGASPVQNLATTKTDDTTNREDR
jgi:hypothetical protein